MPSGDAIQSAAYVVFLSALGVNPLALLAFHLAVCIGRVYYMCHWVADTVVSSVIGICIARMLLQPEMIDLVKLVHGDLYDF